MQIMVGWKPPVLKFVDREAAIWRKAEESVFVRLPVNEIPDMRLPVVASCQVLPECRSQRCETNDWFEIACDSVMAEYERSRKAKQVMRVGTTFRGLGKKPLKIGG